MSKNYGSLFFSENVDFIEDQYHRYLNGDKTIEREWKEIFCDFTKSYNNGVIGLSDDKKVSDANIQLKMHQLLDFFRSYGHLYANLDPLHLSSKQDNIAQLNLQLEDIKDSTLRTTINDYLQYLKGIYCGNIGFEFMYILDREQKNWLADQIENSQFNLSSDEKKKILYDLIESETFEQFLHVKYPGYKRFSIEGGESAIVALEKIISMSFEQNINEIILGMAHRGRLNVLTKVMGKEYTAMFSEFKGNLAYPENLNVSGDVKYHLGYSCDRKSSNGKNLHISLCYNPSHLEAVNPVALGRVRAKQDFNQNTLGILIHGDASFSGQGIVYESLNLSNLSGYKTKGTIHLVINNQIGFTTDVQNSRSTKYCTDLAKFISAPVFHVNGDDPESVVSVIQIAMEYRNKFNNDVVVDIVCYRRYGHNEGDEPLFTQPIMYHNIANHKTTGELYKIKLIDANIITKEQVQNFHDAFRQKLEQCLANTENYQPQKADWFTEKWSKLYRPTPGNLSDYKSETKISPEKLLSLAKSLSIIPNDFTISDKLKKLLSNRLNTVTSGKDIDWATAESLAFASLLVENFKIRLSGQDSGRGTFSQRHSRLVDQKTGNTYIPLNNLSSKQAMFEVIDSPLSEYAVLGFEYGYSLDSPDVLVIWEAQFGDFANGAQIIIDQFISSAESKWLRSSGLVLLLPHGYEGQGPEHSSGRIERMLQLCAEDNMQVVNCSTPANYFHVLRRQLHRNFRKPLVVFTPKSLLRNKMAVSTIEEFSQNFMQVIPETIQKTCTAEKIRKVIICSGKVYYDIISYREASNIDDVAVIRLEQYYPFPTDVLSEILNPYKNAEVVWCQEEPENMGAWFFVNPYIENVLVDLNIKAKRPSCIARPAASSPACGYAKIHQTQQDSILAKVFN